MLNYQPNLDRVFHGLADPTRRQIVEQLAKEVTSVKNLAAPFDMSLPAVMLHLQVLDSAGIITSRKDGRVRICELNQQPLLQISDWVGQRKATWERMFDQLENLLDGGK